MLICLVNSFFVIPNFYGKHVFAWTYDDSWWLGGESPSAAAGNVRIIYTYPDTVVQGNEFDVGLTLEYLKDSARSNWILFSGVSVVLLPYSSSNDTASQVNVGEYSQNYTSDLLRPGESYSHLFNLTASKPGKYLVFVKLIANFGPGGGFVQSIKWEGAEYYDQTSQAPGVLKASQLQPITVVDKYEKSNQPNLIVRIQKPFSEFSQVEVEVRDHSTNLSLPKLVSDARANFPLLYNHTYSVKIPTDIPLVKDKIRANFVNWSDGENSAKKSFVERQVTLDKNKELYALYKTQYKLEVNSSDSDVHTEGTGWYDSGNQADFLAAEVGLASLLRKFDRWTGDISDKTTQSSGSLNMDGPKIITAHFENDFTYLAIIIGTVAGVATILDLTLKKGPTSLWRRKKDRNQSKNSNF